MCKTKVKFNEMVEKMIKSHTELMSKRFELVKKLLSEVMDEYSVVLDKSFISDIRWNKEKRYYSVYMVDHLYNNGKKVKSFAISSWFKINIDTNEIFDITVSITDVYPWYTPLMRHSVIVDVDEDKEFNRIESICNKDSLENFVKDNIDLILDLCKSHHYVRNSIEYLLVCDDIKNMQSIGDYERINSTIRFGDFNELGLHADLYFHSDDYGMEHAIIPLRTDQDIIPYMEKNKLLLTEDDMRRLKKSQEILKSNFFK